MVENRINEDGLFMSCFINGSKKSIVFANGIPSYVTKHHPLVKFCKEEGINLFIPRYPGSLESNGEFSIDNCKRAMEDAIVILDRRFATELFGNSKFSWEQEQIYLVGYSFGALPALLAEINEEKIKRILICPFLNLKLNMNHKTEVIKELEYIERAYPNLFRFKVEELKKEYFELEYPKKRKFTAFFGKEDKTLTKEEIDFTLNLYHPKVIEFNGGHMIPYSELKEELK